MRLNKNLRNWLTNVMGFPATLFISLAIYASTSLATTPDHQIDITDFVYSTETVNVKVGDVIMWTNNDIVPHTATASDQSWDTGLIAPGQSILIEVTEGMSGDYYCFYHPSMKAHLVIVD